MRTWFDRMLTVASVCAIGFIVYAGVRPGGMLRQWYEERQLVRRQHQALIQLWNGLKDSSAVLGSAEGRVVAVEFSDYQCPFCRRVAPRLDSIVAVNDSIAIAYRHFPLSIHAAADGAAKASICAEEQGRFKAMHHQLFRTTAWEEDQNWSREAIAAGVPDLDLFRACLASPETVARIEADKDLARRLGISGTPAFVTADKVWTGADIPDDFWRP